MLSQMAGSLPSLGLYRIPHVWVYKCAHGLLYGLSLAILHSSIPSFTRLANISPMALGATLCWALQRHQAETGQCLSKLGHNGCGVGPNGPSEEGTCAGHFWLLGTPLVG
jgi:hypothetical protein